MKKFADTWSATYKIGIFLRIGTEMRCHCDIKVLPLHRF